MKITWERFRWREWLVSRLH